MYKLRNPDTIQNKIHPAFCIRGLFIYKSPIRASFTLYRINYMQRPVRPKDYRFLYTGRYEQLNNIFVLGEN